MRFSNHFGTINAPESGIIGRRGGLPASNLAFHCRSRIIIEREVGFSASHRFAVDRLGGIKRAARWRVRPRGQVCYVSERGVRE